MIAVIFEVQPSADGFAEYLDRAAQLAPVLAEVDGFISVERFESLGTKGKLLSLSFWRDEESVRAWREQEHHRAAQSAGRAGVFDRYRLRVASVIRDYGLLERDEAPSYHAPAAASSTGSILGSTSASRNAAMGAP